MAHPSSPGPRRLAPWPYGNIAGPGPKVNRSPRPFANWRIAGILPPPARYILIRPARCAGGRTKSQEPADKGKDNEQER